MPRVHHVKSARRSRPEIGLEVGGSYYWWQFMRGPRVNSLTPPRPSQLTRSEFMVPYLQAGEANRDKWFADWKRDRPTETLAEYVDHLCEQLRSGK